MGPELAVCQNLNTHLLGGATAVLENFDQLAEGEWKDEPAPGSMLGCNVAGDAVRHRVEEQLVEMWDVEPRWVVSSARSGGIVNGYDHPARLGADRFVSQIGARHLVLQRGSPRPCMVAMVGTAVTIDAQDASGRFLGGLIVPGHGIMLRALEGGTAGLRVPTGEVVDFPTNTSDALTSGGTYAITGAIERMHRHLLLRCGEPPVVLMSGGAAWKVGPYLGLAHEIVDSLIFDGLLVMQSHRLAL